jgi:hypothetical protein
MTKTRKTNPIRPGKMRRTNPRLPRLLVVATFGRCTAREGKSDVLRWEGEAPPEPARDRKKLGRSLARPIPAIDAKKLGRSLALPKTE